MITRQDLAAVIGERTLHTHNTKKLAAELAAYLLEERRTADLESLIRDIMQYRMENGVIEANLVSAHDLPDVVIRDVKVLLQKEYPNARKLNIDAQLDPQVIGGLRIELPNEQLDMTVKAKLDTFKRLTATGDM